MVDIDYNYEFFDGENSNFYYLLGAAVTDGCCLVKKDSKGYVFSVSSKDKDWLYLLQEHCGGKIRSDRNYHRLLFFDKRITHKMIERGCTERKSLDLKLPNVPDQFFGDFLRGCVDGDGCISKSPYHKTKNGKKYFYTRCSVYLCGASLAFLESLVVKLEAFGFATKAIPVGKLNGNGGIVNERVIVGNNQLYRISFGDSNALKLVEFLNYNSDSISMPRKKAKAMEIISHYRNKSE